MEEKYQSTVSFKMKDRKKLEKAFRILLSKRKIELEGEFYHVLEQEFVNISTNYIVNLKLIESRPRVSEQKKEISRFINATKRYAGVIEELNPVAKEKIHSIGFTRVNSRSLDVLGDDLIFFQEIAEEALKEVQCFIDKGGPKKKRAERMYIKELIDIFRNLQIDDKLAAYDSPYEDHYKGAFFDFVQDCFREIGYPPESEKGLGERIKEVKKDLNLKKKRE